MTEAVLDYAPPAERRGFYPGWINVVVAAVAMVATLPGRTQGLGLVTESLIAGLHVDRVAFASMNMWATLIGSTFCLACGPLIDRIGSRTVLAAIMIALGATVVAMSQLTGANGLLITLILTRGLGQSALSVVSLALVGKWFSRRLPMAMGIYSVLIGIGFVFAFSTVGHAAAGGDWRGAWDKVGIALIVLAPICFILARSTPESIGHRVDNEDPGQAATTSDVESAQQPVIDLTATQALRSPAFWAYGLSASVFGMISAALMLFNQDILKEHGFDAHMAVNVITIVMFTGLLANLGGGLLARYISIGSLMAGAMGLLAASLICLPLAQGTAGVYAYAIMNGIAGGIVTVAFFTCWGQVFGRTHLGKIQGLAQAMTVLLSSAGPLLLAACKARTGSSQPLFYWLAPTVALLGLFCALAPVPRRLGRV